MISAYGDAIGYYGGPTGAQILTGTAGNLVGNTAKAAMRLYRGATTGIGSAVTLTVNGIYGVWDLPFGYTYVDNPGTGTYTYSLKVLVTGATCAFGNSDGPSLFVYEIR